MSFSSLDTKSVYFGRKTATVESLAAWCPCRGVVGGRRGRGHPGRRQEAEQIRAIGVQVGRGMLRLMRFGGMWCDIVDHKHVAPSELALRFRLPPSPPEARNAARRPASRYAVLPRASLANLNLPGSSTVPCASRPTADSSDSVFVY